MYTAFISMGIDCEILEYLVEGWKQHFGGTSALVLANAFNLTHEKIIVTIKALADNGLVHFRWAPITQMVIGMDGKTEVRDEINTIFAFPARTVLEKTFEEEGKDYGSFTNRLHKGDSPIGNYYFRLDVLDKYLRYPDRYHVNSTIIGGSILCTDAYYLSLPEDRREQETVAQIRYGKRKLKSGSIAIAALAKDLSDLPMQEQSYWESYECKTEPDFAEDDYEFEQYKRQMFGGQWGDYEDPIQGIRDSVDRINCLTEKLVGAKLFKNISENPYLQYLVINNNGAYQNAHRELYKLLGADSLDKKVLIGLLERVGAKGKEPVKKNGKKWVLFNTLVMKFPDTDFKSFQICFDARVKDAHKIGTRNLSDTDLVQEFRKDCEEILVSLKKLESNLNSLLTV
jgi:hypothetical protein